MTVRILDDISQESCVGLELVGRRSSTINTYWLYTLVITYLDGLNASSPTAEYFIELSFASFANRPAT